MKAAIWVPLSLALSMLFTHVSHASHAPLETVESVDLTRYQGTWFEIARLPQWFEKGCVGVTAQYSLRPDGKVNVVNSCRKKTLDGKLKVARGKARAVDSSGAKLKVTFFWPFAGDYWILELGPNYEYVAVGSPNRKTLWLLSRTPTMDETLVQEVLDRRRGQGFNVDRMERPQQVPQPLQY